MIDLKAIEERCEAATKGPWMIHFDTGSIDSVALDDPDGDWRVATAIREEDREFIAHARKDVPELVDEVEYWRDRSKYWRVRCAEFTEASRKLMYCEEQRQQRQDENEEVYGERGWVPPRKSLYQRSVELTGECLRSEPGGSEDDITRPRID